MWSWKVLRDRFRALRDSDAVHREIDEELRFHIDMKTEFLVDFAVNGLPISQSPESVSQNFPRPHGTASSQVAFNTLVTAVERCSH